MASMIAIGALVLSAYSVQLHVHGSWSEGTGSMLSSTLAAADEGVDVIWWSDHDYAFHNWHSVSAFSFDAWTEPLWAGEDWEPEYPSQANRTKSFVAHEPGGTAELSDDAVDGKSLWLRDGAAYRFTAEGPREQLHSLAAELTIEISAKVDSGEASMELVLSHNGSQRERFTYDFPVTGQWETYAIVPQAHDDNALHDVILRADGSARFDSFKIRRGLSYPATYAKQRGQLDILQRTMPAVRQLQGVELSRGPHFNVFSEASWVPDYDSIKVKSGYADADGYIQQAGAYLEWLAHWLVDEVHLRGGLVSLNHMFGASWDAAGGQDRAERLAELLDKEVYGVDLLEVGYRERGGHDLQDHLWIWDQLWLAGHRVVGTGVSDTHTWWPGYYPPNNFVTWVWAESNSKADLIEGMRAGRVFFGDILLFDGTIRLREGLSGLYLDEKGLDPTDTILVMTDGVQTRTQSAGERFTPITAPGCHRIEVYTEDGDAKVFTNPVCIQ